MLQQQWWAFGRTTLMGVVSGLAILVTSTGTSALGEVPRETPLTADAA